jgi:AbrB family looped-hinge helix DNA binding protein
MSGLFHARLGDGGRLQIPATCRKRLGWNPGDEVLLEMRDDGLYVMGADRAVLEVQDLVRRYIPSKLSLVDELLQDRRKDAKDE